MVRGICEACWHRPRVALLAPAHGRWLAACPCGRMVGPECRRGEGRCLRCADLRVAVLPIPLPFTIPRAVARLGLALTAALVLVSGVAAWRGPGTTPSGAVLSEQGTPAPPVIAVVPAGTLAPPGPSPFLGPATGSVGVTGWTMPAWTDAAGEPARQLLLVIENRGASPVEVVAVGSRFTVADGADTVVTGALEAVIPPVLEPGARGFGVATLAPGGRLPAGLAVTAELEVRAPAAGLVALVTRRVRFESWGATIAVSGVARNPGSQPVTGGVVGAVLLDATGRPLAAVLDTTGAATLAPGTRAPFRAAEPAMPPPDGALRSTVGVVAFGWATVQE